MIFDKVYFLGVWQDPDIWGVNKRLQNVKFSGHTLLTSLSGTCSNSQLLD
jgi:hypothetical protein